MRNSKIRCFRPRTHSNFLVPFLLLALFLSSSFAAFAITPVFVRVNGDDANCDGSVDFDDTGAPIPAPCAFASLARRS